AATASPVTEFVTVPAIRYNFTAGSTPGSRCTAGGFCAIIAAHAESATNAPIASRCTFIALTWRFPPAPALRCRAAQASPLAPGPGVPSPQDFETQST